MATTFEELAALHVAVERLLLLPESDKWAARNAERHADEAKTKSVMVQMFSAINRSVGVQGFIALVRQAEATADAQGKLSPAASAVIYTALRQQTPDSILEEHLPRLMKVLRRAALRSMNAERELLGLAPVETLQKTALYADEELLFRRRFPQLFTSVEEFMANAVGSHAKAVTGVLVNAADPASPLPIPALQRQLRDEISDLSVKRATMIARTETARVYAQTAMATMRENGIERARLVTAGDPCPLCIDVAAEGFLPVGEVEPPIHPNCFISGTSVVAVGVTSSRVTAAAMRWYVGEVARLQTAARHEITVTPNHPILTGRGWVMAKDVHEGDYLVCCSEGRRLYDEDNVPTLIEDSIKTCAAKPLLSVPTRRTDFHGDGIDAEVAIVFADSLLRHRADSEGEQHKVQALLSSGAEAPNGLFGKRAAAERFECMMLAAPRLVRGTGVGSVLRGGALSHQQLVGLCTIADRDVTAAQSGVEAFAPRQAQLAAKAVERLTGGIALDEVVKVGLQFYAGHVYSLQSETGIIIANNIITQNCRCDIIADVENWLPPLPTTDESSSGFLSTDEFID